MSNEPCLLLVYGRDSASPVDLAGHFADLARLCWVLVRQPEEADRARTLRRLMAHFGEVHLAEGRSAGELAADLVAAGPTGIIPLDDPSLAFAADLAAELGLACLPRAAVPLLTDKVAQRRALRAAGLATPAFAVLGRDLAPAALADLVSGVGLPAVLKPRQGSGSRHTYPIDSFADLLAVLDGAGPFAGADDLLLEQRLADGHGLGPGIADYVSVESVLVEGRAHHLGLTGKFPLAEPFRETGGFVPATLEPELARAVEEVTERALEAVGLRDGASHTEVKLTPTGPVVIEVNGRVGGGPIDGLYADWLGVPISRLAAAAALDRRPPTLPVPADDVLPYAFYLQPPVNARRCLALGGLEQVARLPGFRDLQINLGPGDRLDWRQGSQGYLVVVRGAAADVEQLRAVPSLAEKLLAPSYELAEPVGVGLPSASGRAEPASGSVGGDCLV